MRNQWIVVYYYHCGKLEYMSDLSHTIFGAIKELFWSFRRYQITYDKIKIVRLYFDRNDNITKHKILFTYNK